MSTPWSLTADGVSNPRSTAEPGCLGTGINSETGTEIGGPSSVANAVVLGAWSTPTTLSGEILKSTRPFQWRVGEKNLVTHLVGLSNLESISIDDGVGARDKWRREDSFPLKDPAILRMRLLSGCLSFDMMIRRESLKLQWAQGCVTVCSSHDFLLHSRCKRNTHKNQYLRKANMQPGWILRWRLRWRLPCEGVIRRCTISNGKPVSPRASTPYRVVFCTHKNLLESLIEVTEKKTWKYFELSDTCSKEAISEVSRAPIDFGDDTLRPGTSLYSHLLPPRMPSSFQTLLEFVIANGGAPKVSSTAFVHFAPFKSSKLCRSSSHVNFIAVNVNVLILGKHLTYSDLSSSPSAPNGVYLRVGNDIRQHALNCG